VREKIVKLAKQAGKLLAIELFVPGGTLVVLAILLARGSGSWMSSRLTTLPAVQITGARRTHGDPFLTADAFRSVP